MQDGGYLPDRELLEAQVHFGTIGDTMLGSLAENNEPVYRIV